MDTLSGTASIIAVIQLATQLGGALKAYYKGVRDAREDINRLFVTISSLHDFLKEVIDTVRRSPVPELENVLKSPTGPVKLLLVELNQLSERIDVLELKRTIGRALQRLKWPLKKGDAENIVKNIERHKSTLSLQLELGSLNVQIQTFDIVREINEDIRRAQDGTEHRQIVAWLGRSLPDPSKYHNSARDKHEETTGTWLIEGDEMKSWTSAENSLLWLNGGAGAGKTILSSTVIEHLKRLCTDEEGTMSAVVFWYYSFADESTQVLSNLICSLVKDLCSRSLNIPQTCSRAYIEANNGQQRPTTEILLMMLEAVLLNFDHVYVVIDALDECPRSGRGILLDTLKSIRTLMLAQLHLFVTSRRENDITRALEDTEGNSTNFQDVSVQGAHVQKDIEKYIESKLLSAPFNKWTQSEQDRVKSKLAEQADGMFRLVALQLEALSGAMSPKRRRETLDKLPKTLDDFYLRMLTDIPEEYSEMARKALIWIAYSPRPMTLVHVAEAVLIQSESPYFDPEDRFDDEEDILSILPAGLVRKLPSDPVVSSPLPQESMQSSPVVQFAHYSVKEYLLSPRAPEEYRTSDEHNHSLLVEACIAYILHAGNRPSATPPRNSVIKDFPLLRRVCEIWTHHAQLTGEVINDVMDELVREIFRTETDALAIWFYFSDQAELSALKNFRMLRKIWSNSPTNVRNTCKASSWLVLLGVNRLLRVLLKARLIPLSETKDVFPYVAVRSSQLETAQLLHEAGFNFSFRVRNLLQMEMRYATQEVQIDFSARANVPEDSDLLRVGMRYSTPEMVGWLLTLRPSIGKQGLGDAEDCIPGYVDILGEAVRWTSPEMVHLLLTLKIDNGEGNAGPSIPNLFMFLRKRAIETNQYRSTPEALGKVMEMLLDAHASEKRSGLALSASVQFDIPEAAEIVRLSDKLCDKVLEIMPRYGAEVSKLL